MYVKYRCSFKKTSILLPACILGQLFLLPCSVTSSKVFVGCPLQTLPTKTIGVGIQILLASNGSVSWLLYRDKTLGEFLAGLTWCRLDFDHRKLGEKHQSRKEGPGPPHDPKYSQQTHFTQKSIGQCSYFYCKDGWTNGWINIQMTVWWKQTFKNTYPKKIIRSIFKVFLVVFYLWLCHF